MDEFIQVLKEAVVVGEYYLKKIRKRKTETERRQDNLHSIYHSGLISFLSALESRDFVIAESTLDTMLHDMESNNTLSYQEDQRFYTEMSEIFECLLKRLEPKYQGLVRKIEFDGIPKTEKEKYEKLEKDYKKVIIVVSHSMDRSRNMVSSAKKAIESTRKTSVS